MFEHLMFGAHHECDCDTVCYEQNWSGEKQERLQLGVT